MYTVVVMFGSSGQLLSLSHRLKTSRMVKVVLLFGLLSDLAPVGAVMFADSLAGPLVTVEEGSAVSRWRDIDK